MTDNEGIDFNDVDEVEGEIELTPPEVYASNLIEWATDRHASDLFVSDHERSVVVAVKRLGRVEPVRRLARDYGRKLQGHLRVLAGADAGEFLRPAEGRGVINTPSGGVIDLRLSCIPTLYGQDVAVRLFHPVRGARSLGDLGLEDWEYGLVRQLAERPSGLILVAGPVASGKSSTLYAMVDHLNDGSRKIHTLEDPIEHSIAGVMQSQINLRAGLDFADLLSAVLRHSPDVIMIGEIRDPRTAATAVRAGASGQLVLATLHAKTSAEAVDSMLQYDVNPKFLASSLIGVINQRLVRKLCSQCHQTVETDEDLEVSDGVKKRLGDRRPVLRQKGGCEQCHSGGFQTLTCLPEIMIVQQQLSEAIVDHAPAAALQKIASDQGMLTLEEAAYLRVIRGQTTADEANRVVPCPSLAALAAVVRDSAQL
ncbi:MAG: Flp pilus assembly complex ATPase component TadA [Pirellulales bacterium]|nr:Flp pilus assembly complex ATPase component TadA [Pirellulales bacterium]